MRVIAKFTHLSRLAKVYRDSTWGEYRIKFWQEDEYMKEADYHTTDKDEALQFAQRWAEGVAP